jgi:nucleoside-diphosphate-sugar epimerase
LITKKILIAGGTGFIGFHLAKKCLKKGWEVTSLSTSYPQKKKRLKNVNYLICDISKKNELKKIKNYEFDYVVNLAGYVDHSNKEKVFKVHYEGCKNLANFFLLKKIKKFIQVGSSIEYGKKSSPHSEKIITKNTYSYYGNAKLLSTNYLLKLFKKKKFPVCILRPYLLYGPNQDFNRIISSTIQNCLNGKTFNCSEGIQNRDFLFIDDFISAIIKVINLKSTIGHIFNVGSGKKINIKRVIKKIQKIIGKGEPQFGKIPMRKDEIISLYPSIKKMKKLTKWKPIISFDRGLVLTIKYYKKNISKK